MTRIPPAYRSRYVDGDPTVHLADWGGSGVEILLVHGLGGSYLNWMTLAPLLTPHGHVTALDLPGFGLTPPGTGRISIDGLGRTLASVMDSLSSAPVVLVGNSMGGALCILEAAARPERVQALALLDPALPLTPSSLPSPQVALRFALMAVPLVAESLAERAERRVGPEGGVRDMFELCMPHPEALDKEVLEAHFDLARVRYGMPWRHRTMTEATRSLLRVLPVGGRLHQAVRAVRAPTKLIHGAVDCLVPYALAQATASMRPEWGLETFKEVGHTPQLEEPERTRDAIVSLMERSLAHHS